MYFCLSNNYEENKNDYEEIKSSYEDNMEKSLVRVPSANQVIELGTMILASKISFEVYIRKDMPTGNYYLVVNDIVGK